MASRHLHPYPQHPAGERLRLLAAVVLRAASVALAHLARHVERRARRQAPRADLLEFHAEAGAPEGALYVDGQLVGHLPGVQRL